MFEINLKKKLIMYLYVSDHTFRFSQLHPYFLAESSNKGKDFNDDAQIHHAHSEYIIFLQVSVGISYSKLSPLIYSTCL